MLADVAGSENDVVHKTGSRRRIATPPGRTEIQPRGTYTENSVKAGYRGS